MSDNQRQVADYVADMRSLLERIDALEGLLVCYRIGKHPTESLFRKLERTKADDMRIRQWMETRTDG